MYALLPTLLARPVSSLPLAVMAVSLIAAQPSAAQEARQVYRCPGPPVLYTDTLTLAEARERGCRGIEGTPVTVVQGRPRAVANAAPAVASAAAPRPGDTRVDPAAQRAREAGKLSGLLARLTEEALAPQVSWRAALAHCLLQAARDDYSWLRPSRRTGEMGGDAIFPSLRSHAGDIFVALDTSGSIEDADLAQFVGELNAIKGTLPVRLTLFACDAALVADAPWVTEPWEEFRLPRQFGGGGGTAFAPVFDWIEREGARPDALVYFTDAQGDMPQVPPNFPVLWLVKGKAPVPWGRRIQLN